MLDKRNASGISESSAVMGITWGRWRGFMRPGFAIVAKGAFAVKDGFLVGTKVLFAGCIAPIAAISGMIVTLGTSFAIAINLALDSCSHIMPAAFDDAFGYLDAHGWRGGGKRKGFSDSRGVLEESIPRAQPGAGEFIVFCGVVTRQGEMKRDEIRSDGVVQV